MKTNPITTLSVAAIALCAFVSTSVRAEQEDPSIPVGSLSAYPTVVQTGTKPNLTWKIEYPSTVVDLVTIEKPGTVKPKHDMPCKIRILGMGVTSQASNGKITYYRTRAMMTYNGGSAWTEIYDGSQNDTVVAKQQIVKAYPKIQANKPMNFAGQYYNGGWKTLCSSTSGDLVRTLVNGETPPSNVPAYNAPSLATFLKPYLDASGKIKIGPLDVIVIMELTHTNKSDVGYDLQDLVMLITFSNL